MARKKKPVAMPVESNVTNETFLKHVCACIDLRTKLEEANGKYRSALKAADNDGIDTKTMIRAMNARRRDPEDVKRSVINELRYLALLNIPTVQLDLFPPPDAPDPEQVAWAAGELGLASGKRGDDAESACPYPAGTREYLIWQEKYDEGAKIAAELLQPNEKNASTRRRRQSTEAGLH